MGVVPRAKAGVGSAVNDATRLLGGTLGVAVIGSVYASLYSSRLTEHLPARVPAGLADAAHNSVGAALAVARGLAATGHEALGGGVARAASGAFIDGLSLGCIVAGGVAALGAMMAAVLLPAFPSANAEEAEPARAPIPSALVPAGSEVGLRTPATSFAEIAGEAPRSIPGGRVAERLNAAVLKTVRPGNRSRGFESPPFRSSKPNVASLLAFCRLGACAKSSGLVERRAPARSPRRIFRRARGAARAALRRPSEWRLSVYWQFKRSAAASTTRVRAASARAFRRGRRAPDTWLDASRDMWARIGLVLAGW